MALIVTHNSVNDMMQLTADGVSLGLPYTSAGLKALRSILIARATTADHRIGTPAAPTQAQVSELVERWLRERTEKIFADIKLEKELDL